MGQRDKLPGEGELTFWNLAFPRLTFGQFLRTCRFIFLYVHNPIYAICIAWNWGCSTVV